MTYTMFYGDNRGPMTTQLKSVIGADSQSQAILVLSQLTNIPRRFLTIFDIDWANKPSDGRKPNSTWDGIIK